MAGIVADKGAGASRWSAERRALFLAHLAETSNVRASERAAGMRVRSAYTERARNPAFCEAWEAALRDSYDRLEIELLDRARNGERKTRRNAQTAKLVGYDTEYSERLALTLLAQHRASLRGAGGGEDVAAVRRRLTAKIAQIRREVGDA